MNTTSLKVGLFLAMRQLRRGSIGTTVLIIFIMMLTFLNLVVVGGILVGLVEGSVVAYASQYSGGVLISQPDNKNYIENSQPLINTVRYTPGVAAISARYVRGAKFLADFNKDTKPNEKPNETTAQLTGINPTDEDSVTGLSRNVIEGEYLTPNEEGYILVGSGKLRRFSGFNDPSQHLLENINVGSKIRVTMNDGNTKDFTVKGVVKSKIEAVSQRFYINERELRRLANINDFNVNEIAVHLEPNYSSADVKGLISASPDASQALVQTSEESQGKFIKDISATFDILGKVIGGIALSVASITVFIVIFINAVTRRKFIGILKGIGITGLAIEFSYIIQSLFYAIAGTGFGLILLYGVLKPYFNNNPIDFPFSDGILVATPSGTIARVLILLVITLVAGYVPAKLIIRKNTLDSILGR